MENRNINKVKNLRRFYLQIDSEILSKAIELAGTNRDQRRSIERKTTFEEKINIILQDESLHTNFITNLHLEYFADNVLDLNYKDFEELQNDITSVNFEKLVIHALHTFYRDEEFNNFINSQKFDADNFIEEKNEKQQNENYYENELQRYVVKFKVEGERGQFNNIVIKCKFSKNGVERYEVNELPEYLRGFRRITVQENGSSFFCNEPKSVFRKLFEDGKYSDENKYWLLTIDDNLITSQEKNENTKSAYIEAADLSKCLVEISTENIFEFFEYKDSVQDFEDNMCKSGIILDGIPSASEVYIKVENYLYGGFEHTETGYSAFKLKRNTNDYIKTKIKINDSFRFHYTAYNSGLIFIDDTNSIQNDEVDFSNKSELLEALKYFLEKQSIQFEKYDLETIRGTLSTLIDNSLQGAKREKLSKLLKETIISDEFVETEILELVDSLITNARYKDEILKIVSKLEDFENINFIKDQKNKVQENLEELQATVDLLNKEIEELKANNLDKLMDEYEKEIQELEDKKNNLQKMVEKLDSQITLEELTVKVKDSQADYDRWTRSIADKQSIAESLEEQISNKQEELANLTVIEKENIKAGFIDKFYEVMDEDKDYTKTLYDTITNWNNKNYGQEVVELYNFEDIRGEVKFFEEDEKRELVVNYLYQKAYLKRRNLKRNDFVNILICISQGFLTIFAGEPGVGKTSMCNIVADVIGVKKMNRFVEVSVEKEWTSKRDLIGYYNPLSKVFEKNNSELYNALTMLNKEHEANLNDFPFLVLLDEANLSSMEHYWSEFMNVCDFDKGNDDRKINLGHDYCYNIPETLRFLATINYDWTTERLSPRIIDRAWIVLMGDYIKASYNYLSNNLEEIVDDKSIILFNDFVESFSNNRGDIELPKDLNVVLNKIYSAFREININFNFRTDKMIKKYILVGKELFESDDDMTSEKIALDYAVSQKLLTKIDGYGKEYREKLEKLRDLFQSEDFKLEMCTRIINDVIKKGDNNMENYQFFS